MNIVKSLVIIMALFLSACGGGGSGDSSATTTESVTIKGLSTADNTQLLNE